MLGLSLQVNASTKIMANSNVTDPHEQVEILRVTIRWTRILCRPSHILLTLYKDLVASHNCRNNINTMVVAILDAIWSFNDFTPLKSTSVQVNAALGMRYRMPICIAESKTNTFSKKSNRSGDSSSATAGTSSASTMGARGSPGSSSMSMLVQHLPLPPSLLSMQSHNLVPL